jgi:hypothetical protein
MMEEQELERRLDEARPHWPTIIESAWAVLPGKDGGVWVEGPYDTAEAAHRVTIPVGGRVVYNCADGEQAAAAVQLTGGMSR